LKGLEDEANPVAAEFSQLPLIQASGGLAIDENIAGIGEVHRPGEIQQCGLSATATPYQHGHRTRLGDQGDFAQRGDALFVQMVSPRNIPQFKSYQDTMLW
jgi:hypothetical protein